MAINRAEDVHEIETKPCLGCGAELPVTREQMERRLYFPMCQKCRLQAARAK